MGRDRRRHRHGRRDAGLPARPVGPQGVVRREGTLDAARDAWDDSLCDAGTGRAAGGPFRGGLLRRVGPRRALDRRDRRHQRALLKAVRAVHRQRDGRVVGALRHGVRAILRSRFHSPAELPRSRRFHRAGSLASHLRRNAALVCRGREAVRSSRTARSAAAGGGRGGSACGAAVFGRQPAAGRLSGRARIASLSPADGL